MLISRPTIVLFAALASAGAACTENAPCDTTTTFHEGVCKRRPAAVDAGASERGGSAATDDGASGPTFGTSCKDGVNHSDCQGAVVNGCFILPGQAAGFCSYVGCDKDDRCPPGWMCLDLSKFQAGAPWGCVKL